ncbi:MAG: PD-(D/E)XK nuclease family protein [Verrucomicrobia bacterium]|nr:PD-(D/E)XK nuclease family protein [Verrucomicrobiota bacterium]
MTVRFLLGPAGSGKTFRCLAEIRTLLLAEPTGSPLVLLAPKQATFQLERQLLSDPALPGYTRLRILSFDRLAEWVLEQTGMPGRDVLSADGRVMVLRALLARLAPELRVFHATARLTGLAQQLSGLLREFQEHQITPARLEKVAASLPPSDRLGDKLRDLARMLAAYEDWLRGHELHDATWLLDLAARALKLSPRAIRLGGLWLDGFAEMTPQELELLTALVPCADRATVAFCLPSPIGPDEPWLSLWSVNARTCAGLQTRLRAVPEVKLVIECLPAAGPNTRFANQPVLAHVATHWVRPQPWPEGGHDLPIRLVACRDARAEVVEAAREIWRFVRAGGRFREAAVLVRSLEPYHDIVRRVFRRYGIPCFVDRREAVGHHPLAELTRQALRTIALGWRHDDWFGALKTGLVPAAQGDLDELENEALARGWRGERWLRPLDSGDAGEGSGRWERLRQQLVAPFLSLREKLSGEDARPNGSELAAALRGLWRRLGVERRLLDWSETDSGSDASLPATAHATVWEQTNDLLDNLARAFAADRLPLSEWLPILEAGLANLTVGVIPPTLDQVLVGAVDRSRNPDLRLLIVLGMNEGVFPAVPPAAMLLTDADRDALAAAGLKLGPDRRQRIGRERYFGYIACTRARERLVLTWAAADRLGRGLNPSPLVEHLQQLLPSAKPEDLSADAGGKPPLATGKPGYREVVHPTELLAAALRGERPAERMCQRLAASGWRELERLREVATDRRLSPAMVNALFGATLTTSVSRLEDYAACPFRHFVRSVMRADERELFEVDARRRGSFQHEVLARFHHQLRAENRRWRDLTPDAAAARIEAIGQSVAAEFGAGLFEADDRSLFTAASLTRSLMEFIRVVIRWLRESYDFNPVEVELAFGLPEAPLPAWELALGDGRCLKLVGRVDRLDVAAPGPNQPAWCVVLDYKTRARSVDPVLLEHGIQLQLPAYLTALTRLAWRPQGVAGTGLRPAGFFYVSWQPKLVRCQSRRDAETEDELKRAKRFLHRGRFNVEALPWLERQPGAGQFACRRNKDGELAARQADPMTGPAFDALLERAEAQLKALARGVLSGDAAVDPYQKGAKLRACGTCDYQAICRIDPWTHPFRRLKGQPEAADEG